METIHPRCAGLDVHNEKVQANIRCLDMQTGQLTFDAVRSYSTMTCDLEELAAWMKEHGVTHVAMESTGVFWKPIFNVLDGRFQVLLCNAQHIKNVPGRKTDVKDCQWICQLNQHGLLRGSFVPATALRELRDLTRHRAELLDDHTRIVNRLQKVLQDANIKLSVVASDVLGVSGRAMIQALIAGVTDPVQLAGLALRRLKRKRAELAKAFDGRVSEHHRYMLRLHWEHLLEVERLIAQQDARIDAHIASSRLQAAVSASRAQTPGPMPQVSVASPPAQEAPQAVAVSARSKGQTQLPYSFPAAVEALDKIAGINKVAAQAILAETGTNMGQFPDADHISSWGGLCPGNRRSAGKQGSGKTTKGNHWLRRILTQAAWAAARTKDSYYRALFKRLVGKRGKQRALVAVSHSLLVAIYHILKEHTDFVDLGVDYFEHLHEERRLHKHIRALQTLGYTVTPPQVKAAS